MELHLSRDEALHLAEVLSTALAKLRSDDVYTGDYALDLNVRHRTVCVAALLDRLERAIDAPVEAMSPPVEVPQLDAARR